MSLLSHAIHEGPIWVRRTEAQIIPGCQGKGTKGISAWGWRPPPADHLHDQTCRDVFAGRYAEPILPVAWGVGTAQATSA